MPTTTLAPPKSFRGISPRELMSAESGDAGPPVTVFGATTRWYTLKAGLPLIIDSPVDGVTRHVERDTDPISDSVAGYKQIRFQCPVLATTVPEGTRLALRVLTYIGGAWSYFTVADAGPWLPIHEVATDGSGVIIPVLSDWFTIDAEFDQDNIVVEWVTYGGDGTGEVTLGNIHVQFSANTRPPTSEIPDPEPPSTSLLVDWDPTEGVGTTVADKAGNGHTLSLGGDTQAPGWVADPTRGLGDFGGSGTAFLLKCAFNSTLPYNAGGGANDLRRMSIFFYLKLSAAPGGGTHWVLYNEGGSTSPNLNFRIVAGKAQATRYSPPTATDHAVTSTTTLVDEGEYTICATTGRDIGDTVKLYINGVLEDSETLVGAITAFAAQPVFSWGGPYFLTFDSGVPGVIGRMLIWDGEITAAEVAATHAAFKVIYPGLP